MNSPKDEDLLFRLRNFEDNFVERKTARDTKDWLKTVVAFANSTPLGSAAAMFIGVRQDGSIEDTVTSTLSRRRSGRSSSEHSHQSTTKLVC